MLVGTASGTYNYGPSGKQQKRAGCVASRSGKKGKTCTMPHGGVTFALVPDRRPHAASPRRERLVQAQRRTFTIFTIDGDRVTATPMGVADGVATPMSAP